MKSKVLYLKEWYTYGQNDIVFYNSRFTYGIEYGPMQRHV